MRSDPPYSFINYADKSKFHFLHNAMMMIICSSVKIITTHTHTHTHKNTKFFFFFTQSNCCNFHYTSWLGGQPQICCVAHISSYTNILTITYTSTHTIKHKYNLHILTHKELYTILTFFWVYFFIFSIPFFLCLMIVIYKTAWNLGLQTSFHVIKYIY